MVIIEDISFKKRNFESFTVGKFYIYTGDKYWKHNNDDYLFDREPLECIESKPGNFAAFSYSGILHTITYWGFTMDDWIEVDPDDKEFKSGWKYNKESNYTSIILDVEDIIEKNNFISLTSSPFDYKSSKEKIKDILSPDKEEIDILDYYAGIALGVLLGPALTANLPLINITDEAYTVAKSMITSREKIIKN